MNRENELHFAETPTLQIGRSKFDRPTDVKTSFNAGDIVPIYCQQYIPGDSIKMKMSNVIRMMTPMVPVMDEVVCDVYFFNVPWRLIWDDTKKFIGEKSTEPWVSDPDIEIPQLWAPEGEGWDIHSLAGYLFEPTGIEGISCSALKTRAYCSIYNNWFRSEPLQSPVYIDTSSGDTEGCNWNSQAEGYEYDPITDTQAGAKLLKACKTFDYFTGCLPSAQAGPTVYVPMLGDAPVYWNKYWDDHEEKWRDLPDPSSDNAKYAAMQSQYGDGGSLVKSYQFLESGDMTEPTYVYNPEYADYSMAADLSRATGASIIQLRQSFAIQKFYERCNLTGQKYGEIIKGHFSVTNPDYRNMVPEYLGGFRTPISVNQVVQTSSTDSVSPQGNTAAYSVTVNRKDDLFSKSFTEWGIIMGLAVVRIAHHSYQQGQDREWTKKKRFDFYWPEFANLSAQAVLNKEIYAQGTSKDEEAFGYQEAWAEMRYDSNHITAELRSDAPQSLEIWHYADDYDSLPKLNSNWIVEDEANISRTLAVQNHDQFFGDFYMAPVWTRPLPTYSIPGLIDHH